MHDGARSAIANRICLHVHEEEDEEKKSETISLNLIRCAVNVQFEFFHFVRTSFAARIRRRECFAFGHNNGDCKHMQKELQLDAFFFHSHHNVWHWWREKKKEYFFLSCILKCRSHSLLSVYHSCLFSVFSSLPHCNSFLSRIKWPNFPFNGKNSRQRVQLSHTHIHAKRETKTRLQKRSWPNCNANIIRKYSINVYF